MMAIDAQELTQAARVALVAASVGDAVQALRRLLPGIRASAVDAFDMRGETPVLRLGDRDMFLMQSDGHCWSVTGDPAHAQAIVLTQRT
ncbi:hypothetical protein [Niveibacterium sp. SC-1]|uniref:hypothetical protein n=1 Tax=Niveibacterium sp. SC-1 TaxID=3135646 RepID=UPI00312048C0